MHGMGWKRLMESNPSKSRRLTIIKTSVSITNLEIRATHYENKHTTKPDWNNNTKITELVRPFF